MQAEDVGNNQGRNVSVIATYCRIGSKSSVQESYIMCYILYYLVARTNNYQNIVLFFENFESNLFQSVFFLSF